MCLTKQTWDCPTFLALKQKVVAELMLLAQEQAPQRPAQCPAQRPVHTHSPCGGDLPGRCNRHGTHVLYFEMYTHPQHVVEDGACSWFAGEWLVQVSHLGELT